MATQSNKSDLPLDARIFVAGSRGMVGSAITRALQTAGFHTLSLPTRAELDLADRRAVRAFFAAERPACVILAAAKVGGILANDTFRADFIHENLKIQLNVIDEAHRADVARLLFLGSSCIYPKHAPQPIKEEHLLTGALEPTNRAYAIAKIAGIEMCDAYHRQYQRDFRAAMPTNLYGPGDHFELASGHVIPALMRRFHEAASRNARSVAVWGSGIPRREFMYVDDLADACLFLLKMPRERWDASFEHNYVNVGTGVDVTIRELADMMRSVVGYEGHLQFERGKPDGTPRKLLDVSRLRAAGWTSRIELMTGLRMTYQWFRRHVATGLE